MLFQTPVPSNLSDFLVGLQSTLAGFDAKLDSIHSWLERKSVDPADDRKWFRVEEAAKELGKKPYTVRQWCNRGQIEASKSEEKRGGHRIWLISRDEIERYKSYGLSPLDPTRNKED